MRRSGTPLQRLVVRCSRGDVSSIGTARNESAAPPPVRVSPAPAGVAPAVRESEPQARTLTGHSARMNRGLAGEDGNDCGEQHQESTHGDTSGRERHVTGRLGQASEYALAPRKPAWTTRLCAARRRFGCAGVANLTLRLGGESVVAGKRQLQGEPKGSGGRKEGDRVHDAWAS